MEQGGVMQAPATQAWRASAHKPLGFVGEQGSDPQPPLMHH